MKPVEAKVLEGLRKTTLAYLSDKQYAEVVEAVEKQGILGLTGAASRIVKGAVIKHGSHDQKTHGKKGGGGGKGSNSLGGAVSAETKNQIQSKSNDISRFSKDVPTNTKELSKAHDELRDAKRALGRATEADTAQASEQIREAVSSIKSAIPKFENENYNSEAGKLSDISVELNSLASALNRGVSKSKDETLQKHGSHDQKTHGRKGGGGGGCGGGSQVDAKESKQVQQTVESAIKGYENAAKTFESELDYLSDSVDTTKDMNRIESARKMLDSSMKDFKEAKSLTGDKQRKKLQVASDKFDSGLGDIDKIELKNDAVQRVLDVIPQEEMRELGIDGIWDI